MHGEEKVWDPLTASNQILGTCLWIDIINCDCIVKIKRINKILDNYHETLFNQLQINGKFENIFLLIFDTCEINSLSDMNIQHSKVIFTNSKIQVYPEASTQRMNHISGFASEIFIDSSSQLCLGDFAWTELTGPLNTSFFKFNECQVTIMSRHINNQLSKVSSTVTSETNATAFITSSTEDNIWGYTSAFVNGDYNYYNFINHMHYASSINHNFDSDNNLKIPKGTLIMFPMCFKAVKKDPNSQWDIYSLIQMPNVNEWQLQYDDTNLDTIITNSSMFSSYASSNCPSGVKFTPAFASTYTDTSDGVKCIFDILNKIFIYQYPELRYNSLLDKTAQFTVYADNSKLGSEVTSINGATDCIAKYARLGKN